MEVSNTTNATGMQWSENAKILILRLVAIDAAQRIDKKRFLMNGMICSKLEVLEQSAT